MASHWLVKSEPNSYSFDDLVRDVRALALAAAPPETSAWDATGTDPAAEPEALPVAPRPAPLGSG